MADDLKVYTAEEIQDTPFPQQGASDLTAIQPTSGGGQIFSPTETAPQEFPVPKISTELISTALNTRSKKILQEFKFTPSGAIQIGVQENAVSGDIRISPAGIVARNSLGDTTFALDGETGDAIFKGTVQAGSLISQSTITGGSININNRFIVDSLGNITALSATLTGYLTNAGTSQVLSGDVQVGNGNVKIDGANKRIIINDGSNDRILIGYQSAGF